MAFPTGYLGDPTAVSAGELLGTENTVLTANKFEDGLLVGRFAKLDTGSIDNIDASATPTIAGVVLRNVAASVEEGGAVDASLHLQWQYIRHGIVTVDVVAADSPVQFGSVYVENQTPVEYGKATTVSAGNVDANAEFLHEVQAGVWAIRLL